MPWVTAGDRSFPPVLAGTWHAAFDANYRRPARPKLCYIARLTCGSISDMTELTDASRAFSYGDSILVGERVRLRGVRDDDLPTLTAQSHPLATRMESP